MALLQGLWTNVGPNPHKKIFTAVHIIFKMFIYVYIFKYNHNIQDVQISQIFIYSSEHCAGTQHVWSAPYLLVAQLDGLSVGILIFLSSKSNPDNREI